MIPNYKLVIGTANWFNDYNGTHVTEKQADEIINYAKSVGITEFDTARLYGDGKAEEYLAKQDGIKVYTKGNNIDEYDISFDLLQDKMEGYFIHRPTLNYSYYKWMKDNIAVSFGVSGYNEREVIRFDEAVGSTICQLPIYELESDNIKSSIFIRKIINIAGIKTSLLRVGLLKNHWDRAVVGVDNADQLKEIVEIWGTL